MEVFGYDSALDTDRRAAAGRGGCSAVGNSACYLSKANALVGVAL